MNPRLTSIAVPLFVLAVSGAGCAHHGRNGLNMDSKNTDSLGNGNQNTIIGCAFTKPIDYHALIRPVYFDFDSYALRSDALTTLKSLSKIAAVCR